MSVTLRDMAPADVAAVAAIEGATFPDPWTPGIFREELATPGRAYVVAEDECGIVGFAGVNALDEDAHLMNIAVRRDMQGRGIGRELIVSAMERAAGLGARRITLEVRPGNAVAIALYESLGLRSVGVRPGYYLDTGEDAVIMWGDLPQPVPGEGIAAAERAEMPRTGEVADDLVLAIETSCDETAAAVMRGGRELLANVVASQVDFHARFGGVVPEIASRKHTEAIVGVVGEAMSRAGEALGTAEFGFADLDAIAVTYGPGLIGALVVGVAYAKGLSMATGVPLVGVNHLEGHIFANVFADPDVAPPLVALVSRAATPRSCTCPSGACTTRWARRSTMRPARRSTKWQKSSGWATPAGRSYPSSPRRVIRAPSTSPGRCSRAATTPSRSPV